MNFQCEIVVTWDEFNDEVIEFLKSLPPPKKLTNTAGCDNIGSMNNMRS